MYVSFVFRYANRLQSGNQTFSYLGERCEVAYAALTSCALQTTIILPISPTAHRVSANREHELLAQRDVAAQSFRVIVDTASSNLWLVDSSCTAENCRGYFNRPLGQRWYKHKYNRT